MHVKAQLRSYEKVDFSLTLTAPVEDWRAARKQLEKLKENGWVAWPLSGFVDALDKMLANLDKTHLTVLCKNDDAIPDLAATEQRDARANGPPRNGPHGTARRKSGRGPKV